MNDMIQIVKGKEPSKVVFERNQDGTYSIVYDGMCVIDNNDIYESRITLPRCKVEWNDFQPDINDILTTLDKDSNPVLIKYDYCGNIKQNS